MKIHDEASLNVALGIFGQRRRTIDQVQFRAEVRVAKINKVTDQKLRKPLRDIKAITAEIRSFIDAHWDELPKHGRTKIVKLINGTIRHYITKEAVRFAGTDKELAAALEAAGLANLIRIIKEPNREEIRKPLYRKLVLQIPGLTLEAQERVAVKPRGLYEIKDFSPSMVVKTKAELKPKKAKTKVRVKAPKPKDGDTKSS